MTHSSITLGFPKEKLYTHLSTSGVNLGHLSKPLKNYRVKLHQIFLPKNVFIFHKNSLNMFYFGHFISGLIII